MAKHDCIFPPVFISTPRFFCLLFACVMMLNLSSSAQSEAATLSGTVMDGTGAVIPGTQVQATNSETNISVTTTTNKSGIYVIPSLKPGRYRVAVTKQGFKQVSLTDVTLNVQDVVSQNFTLEVGAASESVTVSAERQNINTSDATVSTVIDRNFAENLPLNGRSFQTLIYLTPGVVPVSAGGGGSGNDSGQFSVNGQRAASNYWMVDGVSANVGSNTSFGGNQMAGAVGTTSVLGGTNSLVSVDAMQEFRIQTSTFAPEFGRTPGAQISIVTRSGTNNFHGSIFDYLRNDKFDANNWFNGYTNKTPLPKAQERQNDFGSTLGGPIVRDRTFFFFSYEGIRLRLPTTALTTVPSATARQNAVPAMQPFLNVYPLDSKQPDLGNGVAQFNASYSDPASLDAYSMRIDHKIVDKLVIFGRYNYSPSAISQRGSGSALSVVSHNQSTAQQATLGSTWIVSEGLVNEARANYSRTDASSRTSTDTFGGAVPLTMLPFPSPFTEQTGLLAIFINGLVHGNYTLGPSYLNVQRQINVVDNFSAQLGSHSFKLGIDYRRLTPIYQPSEYSQAALFNGVARAQSGVLLGRSVGSHLGATFLFQNLSAFAQDTWHFLPRLTMTYGGRWDTDFAPSSLSGPQLPALTASTSDLSQLTLAPAGTRTFSTSFLNVAPRIGVAYQLSQRPSWETVVRGGFGVFYDLATSESGNVVVQLGYPFSSGAFALGGTYPLSSQGTVPPPIVAPSASNPGRLAAFDPNLKLPYTLHWNFSLQQALGTEQTLSLSYVAAVGRRLMQTLGTVSASQAISQLLLVTNAAESNYNALQVQFERRLAQPLQLITSYTWSHSIDTASAGSIANSSNQPSSPGNSGNRGSSDFDVRHAFSAGLTYAIPGPKHDRLLSELAGGWSLQSIIQAQSARPVLVTDSDFFRLTNGFDPDIRPDVMPGVPLYLYGPQFPGGRAINNTPGAVSGGCPDGSPSVGPFCSPPSDPNGNAARQGNLARNVLRGFGLFQWDLGIHREFAIREALRLQFRAEMFNVLNHPNFAPPQGDIRAGDFGLASQMLGQYLSGGSLGRGGFSSLYQTGGPRSLQFALKASF
jgi:hypothetical protein